MSLNPTVDPSPGRRISATVLVVIVVIVAGVAVTGTALYFVAGPGASTSSSNAPGSVTVVDDLGRSVTVPLNASRIVVLAPSIMDTVYRLGLRDRVVGIGCTVSFTGGIYNEYTPNQTALWNLSSSMCVTDFPSLNLEALALLNPQLVLASTLTSATDVAKMTEDYHLRVVILQPSSLDGVAGDVALMAEMFPTAIGMAAALESSLHSTIFNATEYDANLSASNVTPPSVLLTYYFDSGGYYSYGPGSFGQSLIELAGGSSIAASEPLNYGELNATTVLATQPEVVLYGTSWNDPFVVSGETPSNWTAAPYWGQLTGSRIPVDIALVTEVDPTMVLALPQFLAWLHPGSSGSSP